MHPRQRRGRARWVYAAVSDYWGTGGTALLTTIGRTREREGRAGNAALLALVWITLVLKLASSSLGLVAVGQPRWLTGRWHRAARGGAWLVSGVLVLYGGVGSLVSALGPAARDSAPTVTPSTAAVDAAFVILNVWSVPAPIGYRAGVSNAAVDASGCRVSMLAPSGGRIARPPTGLLEHAVMPAPKRRSAMKVSGGRVQKKNNWRLDRDDYFAVPQAEIRIDRRDPAWGHRHLITVAQLRTFVDLLPDWDEVAVGLRAIVLDSADDCMGWHDRGVVAVCAWEQGLWWELAEMDWVREHHGVLERIGVNHRVLTDDEVFESFWEGLNPPSNARTCKGQFAEIRWSEPQARAFQLLHVLPHELGHHHDRMTTRSRRQSARGEAYAERYAHRVMEVVWPAYAGTFGL